MFKSKTQKIEELLDFDPRNRKVTEEMLVLFGNNVYMYIDYANVKPWSTKLGWHISIERLSQFLESFSSIKITRFYHGTLEGDENSEKEIKMVQAGYFNLRTKPVKIMKHFIEYTSIKPDSSSLLSQFIRKALLRKYTGETIEYLNYRFKEMNDVGINHIEDRKCNFDVEIGVDMLLDCERAEIDTFVLWTGDSDFVDPIRKLLSSGKKVILFATAGKVSRELNKMRNEGLLIFDIDKIQDFICWNRELNKKAKGTPFGAPKH